MSSSTKEIKVGRFAFRRKFLKFIGRPLFWMLTKFDVIGLENLPKDEPVLLYCNHFHFADPAPMLIALPTYAESVAGTERPQAPPIMKMLPDLWGTVAVRRGTGARDVFNQAKSIFDQRGILVIFIEGGAWADVLRPPRPGASFIAANNKCRIVPASLMGVDTLFQLFKTGRRGHITLKIGEPFGPVEITGRGRERRKQLEELGEEMMRKIVELLPPEKHGVYSDDPVLRAEAEKVAPFPWD